MYTLLLFSLCMFKKFKLAWSWLFTSLFNLCSYCEGLLHRSIFMCGLFQQTIIKTLSWLPADRLRIHFQTQTNSNALYSEIMWRDPRAFYTDFYHGRWNWKHCSFHCDLYLCFKACSLLHKQVLQHWTWFQFGHTALGCG